MSSIKKTFCGIILYFTILHPAFSQSCAGSWATNLPLSYDCISGQWIGQSNPGVDPTGCPVNPVYTAGQANTFTFSSAVSTFTIDFNAFSTGPACARLEVKINGIFYPLTIANFVNVPASSNCTGSFAAMAVSPDGYITSNAISTTQTNGQGRIIVSGVNATSVTFSTNDGAGSVFMNPINCMTVVPLKLESFEGIATADCKAILKWKSGTESNIKNIEVQRSPDGIEFKKVSEVAPQGSNSKYIFSSGNFSDGYFRLKLNDLDSKYAYSEIIRIKANCSAAAYRLTPNPTHGEIEIIGVGQEDRVLIFDMQARLVLSFPPQQNTIFDINKLAPGMYNVEVVNGEKILSNLKLVKN